MTANEYKRIGMVLGNITQTVNTYVWHTHNIELTDEEDFSDLEDLILQQLINLITGDITNV